MEKITSKLRHRNLPLLLLQAREAVLGEFRPLLNQQGVTEQQWRVIRALASHGPMEPRQIGAMCCISGPSLTGILARMDAVGLILRSRLEQDQRRLLVSLTDAARQVVSELAPQVEARYRELEALVGADFTALLYEMLDALVMRLGVPEGE
ncbi:MAG TPA: homoprotocatechuate degradation operon regulator HpaR [Burkholderiaceae bacterium]|nr:homoprotocatechuate degradation operon regulator HpaR [Burkholderiaceae bacterium]